MTRLGKIFQFISANKETIKAISSFAAGGGTITLYFNSNYRTSRSFSSNYPNFEEEFWSLDSEVEELKKKFSKNNRICIRGLDGIGKTTLAIKICQEFEKEYNVYWFNCGDKGDYDRSLESNARHCNIRNDISEDSLKYVISENKNLKFLYVLDQVKDIHIVEKITGSNLPKNLKILVTTTNQDHFKTYETYEKKPITGTAVKKILKKKYPSIEDSKINKMASTFLTESHIYPYDFNVFLECIENKGVDYYFREANNIEKLFFIHFEQISKEHPSSWETLFYLAYMDGCSVDQTVLRKLLGKSDIREEVTLLKNKCLLYLRKDGKIKIEEHVQQRIIKYIKEKMKKYKVDSQSYLCTLVSTLSRILDYCNSDDKGDKNFSHMAYTHSLKLVKDILYEKEFAITFEELDNLLTKVYWYQLKYDSGLEQGAKIFKDYLDQNKQNENLKWQSSWHYKIGTLYRKLGKQYEFSGKSMKAKQKYEDSKYILEQALSCYESLNDQIGLTDCLLTYGCTLNRQEKFDEAIKAFKESNEINETTQEGREKKLRKAMLLNNIAFCYFSQGKYEESIDYYKLSLKEKDKKNKDGRARTLRNIAKAYEKLGKYDEALDSIKEAYNTVNDIYKESNRVIKECYEIMGFCYEGKGMQIEALNNYYKALIPNQNNSKIEKKIALLVYDYVCSLFI